MPSRIQQCHRDRVAFNNLTHARINEQEREKYSQVQEIFCKNPVRISVPSEPRFANVFRWYSFRQQQYLINSIRLRKFNFVLAPSMIDRERQ